jgi:hypothetical protein
MYCNKLRAPEFCSIYLTALSVAYSVIVTKKTTKLNSVAYSLQANYTDRAAAACQRS